MDVQDQITKLKAEVYDLLAQQEQLQNMINQKHQQIAELSMQLDSRSRSKK